MLSYFNRSYIGGYCIIIGGEQIMKHSYSYDFKDYIARRIVVDKHSTSLTAMEFDIPIKTVEKWVSAYNKNPKCFSGEFIVEKQDVSKLMKKYKSVLKDNDILKKMISSLSKKTK